MKERLMTSLMRSIRASLRSTLTAIAAATLLAPASVAVAQNVDLSTIPERASVQLTIYNSADITLVRETRRITFRPGLNPLQFSWANTLIDPTSVDLRFRTHGDQLDTLDTTFPHDRPQVLSWNVQSELDGDALVEISYFTSGIGWVADYTCIASTDERTMGFEGFVRITNNSGENYENASVRLVVGEINLVERVADLARRGVISQTEADEYRRGGRKIGRFRDDARMELNQEMQRAMARPSAGAAAPKEIIKEGLSEYFIYTIEGTETIPHSWSKRMRLFQGQRTPFDIKYRFRPQEYGAELVRLYILRNDEASKLGTTPLPDGTVRLFRDNGRDGLSFLTATPTKYVPIGQEIELNLGPDPRVVHERVTLRTWRDSFWFKDNTGRRYFDADGNEQIRHDYPVAGWDDHVRVAERIRNDRDQPIDVEFRFPLYGHVLFQCAAPATLHDFQTPQFSTQIAPGVEDQTVYEITYKQGISQKQQNVTIVDE
ncbi:MAG: hypothetical protein HKO59_10995 [Phycisphaerales bacterium]|nr:hypothetical protein [Phycisphaerales bacterium]